MTTISLGATTTILLSVPATTGVWPGGNPSQSMNAMIRFTGAQTGSATIQFTLPGFYIIDNQCTGTTFVKLSPATGTGNAIGAPPGEKCHVFFDGTHMDYVDMGRVGAALDLHTNTTTLPPWMTACTVQPYLVKDGSTYSTASYTALGAMLGSTYGGNGITTFGVPDERARARLPVDTVQAASGATSARITGSAGGFNASVLGTSGGTSTITLVTGNLPPYTPSGTVTGSYRTSAALDGANNNYYSQTGTTVSGSGFAFTGTPQGGLSTPFTNVQPSVVDFLPLIKT